MGVSRTCRLLSSWVGMPALAILAVFLFVAAPSARAAAPASAWQLEAAPYRTGLAIGDANITSTLTNVPVKIVLTPSNFNYADASPDATEADASPEDLAFVAAEDSAAVPTQLPYYVDTWNPGGTSVVWVNVPSISATAATLELYYGGTAPAGTYTGPAAAAAVWSNGYNSVNLFGEKNLNYATHAVTPATPANPLKPAPLSPVAAEAGAGKAGLPTGTEFNDLLTGAAGGATLANNGATTGAAFSQMIEGDAGGQGVELSGPTSTYYGTYMTVPGSDSVVSPSGQMTESVNVYVPTKAITNEYSYFLAQQPGTPAGTSGDLYFRFNKGVVNVYGYPGKTITTNQQEIVGSGSATAGWNTIATVVNGTSMTLYLNGAAIGSLTLTADLAEGGTTAPEYLGEHPGPTAVAAYPEAAFGYDELSFAETARSADWMRAEREDNNNELVDFGTQESIATPRGVAVSSGVDGKATISWDAVAGATEYRVHEGTEPGKESATPVTCAATTATSCTVEGLETDTYYFNVVAVTPAGTSLPSEEVSDTYVANPTGVTATAYYSGSQIGLSWTAVSGATSYSVFEGKAPGAEAAEPVTCASLTATSCVVPGLAAGTAYYFTVVANLNGGSSVPSDEVTTTTPATNTSGDHWQLGAAPIRLPLSATDTNLFFESLIDFPAEVVLTPGNFDYAGDSTDGVAADASPEDLAFVQADDSAAEPTQLHYEVDTWNPGGTSILWVNLPVLPFAGTERLELYYGPAAAGTYDASDPAAVWGNGYTSVNQFSARSANAAAVFPTGDEPTLPNPLPAAPQGPAEDPAASGGDGIPAATLYPDLLGGSAAGATLANNGLTSGAFESNEIEGPVGGQALQLTGVTNATTHGGAYATLPGADADMSASGQLTESTTVYVPASGLTAPFSYFLTQGPNLPTTGETADMFFRLAGTSLNLYVYPNHASTTGQVELIASSPVTAGWNTIGATVEGEVVTLYLNGVAVATGTTPTELQKGGTTAPIFLGEHPGPEISATFPATAFGYDDVAFADTARTADWMQAEFQSEMNEVFTYGASQSPSSPLGVTTASHGDEGGATVSWEAPLDPSEVTGYEVFAGTTPGGESSTPVATVAGDATSAVVSGLPSGTSYFKVKAEIPSGNSLPSAEASYEWLEAPSTVTANDFSDSSVELDWNESAGASSYTVFEGTAPGAEASTPATCARLTATSCVVSGLTYGKPYYFTLVGADGQVSSVASTEATGVPGLGTEWVVPAARERLPIAVDTLPAGQTQQSIEVDLPASFDYADANESQLLFTQGADATPLPYTVAEWNPTGVSKVWVSIPKAGPGEPNVYMYYDGAPTQTQSTVTETGPAPAIGATEYYFVTTGASIEGTPQIGHTLTASRAGFTPSADVYSFEWFDNGTPIAGANGPTLKLEASMLTDGTLALGDQITVRISGIVGDVTLSPESAPDTVALGQFAPGTPTISGPAQVGGTLVANPGNWSPAGTATYQWLRGGAPIAGATSTSYLVTSADEGEELAVEVSEEAEGYADDSATSAPVTARVVETSTPVIGEPTITGTVRVGQTVGADAGTWSPAGAPSYQWLLNGAPIAGATAATYAVVPADAGAQLSVEVSEDTAEDGPESATSAAYEVESAAFVAGVPTVSGSATVGSTLKADAGTWSPSPATVTYQWLLDGAEIHGATGAEFTVPAGDAGHQISVEAFASATGYETAAATSAAMAIGEAPKSNATPQVPVNPPLAAAPPLAGPKSLSLVKKPTVHGRDAAGGKLTVSPGRWNAGGTKVKYQWLRGGKAIPGATKPSFKVTSRYAGAKLGVRLTVTAPGYTAATVTIAIAKKKS